MSTKYQKIVDAVLLAIRHGHYKPGKQQLPSQRRMMELYQVSQLTVERAMFELEKLGAIERKQGSGTFVKATYGLKTYEAIHKFSHILREAQIGHEVENDVLNGPVISIPFADNEEITVQADDTYALYAEWVTWKQPAGEDVGSSERFLNASDDPDVMLGAVQAAIAKRARELAAEDALFAHQDEEAAEYEKTQEEKA